MPLRRVLSPRLLLFQAGRPDPGPSYQPIAALDSGGGCPSPRRVAATPAPPPPPLAPPSPPAMPAITAPPCSPQRTPALAPSTPQADSWRLAAASPLPPATITNPVAMTPALRPLPSSATTAHRAASPLVRRFTPVPMQHFPQLFTKLATAGWHAQQVPAALSQAAPLPVGSPRLSGLAARPQQEFPVGVAVTLATPPAARGEPPAATQTDLAQAQPPPPSLPLLGAVPALSWAALADAAAAASTTGQPNNAEASSVSLPVADALLGLVRRGTAGGAGGEGAAGTESAGAASGRAVAAAAAASVAGGSGVAERVLGMARMLRPATPLARVLQERAFVKV